MDYENLTPQYRIEEYLEAIVEGWVDATRASYPDYPSWRLEEFLDAFITYIWEDGDHPRKPCPEPTWRIEECLRAIYDVMTGAATPWPFPTPTNSIEEYLAAIHAYLADGTELPVPEPVWRIEQWLAYALDAVKQGGGVATTVSGTMVHITNALAKAALSVLASIEPIQDLHGYSSPWPAGGGKNKFNTDLSHLKTINTNGTWSGNVYTYNGVTYTVNSDGSITINGTSTGTSLLFVQTSIPTTEYTNITFTISASGISSISGEMYAQATVCKISDSSVASRVRATPSASTKTAAVTDEQYINDMFVRLSTGASADNVTAKFQLELSSSPTAWTPYSNICPISGRTGLSVYVSPTTEQADATTYAVDWTTEAGTVYGGTLDVVTGLLTVDKGYVDMGSLSWSRNATYNVMYAYVTGKANGRGNLICSNYKTVELYYEYLSSGEISGALNNNAINVKDDAYTSAADFKTAMNGVQLVYTLATPLTYQLTGQEVQMLLGENYVWSSSGDTVSVTYYAEGNANTLQSLNILLGGNYSNPKTADDVSDKEALEIILGGNK